jgi:hypothetical protein
MRREQRKRSGLAEHGVRASRDRFSQGSRANGWALRRVAIRLTATLALAWPLVASAQEGGAQERVAALKESLQRSQSLLRQYQWIETTAIAVKGEEKSRTQKSCYYGVDGKVQKVDVAAPPPPPEGRRRPRGIRAAVIENKKEELTEYMKSAVALVHQYIPPDPAKLQAASAAGKVSIHMGAQGQPARLEFRDYLKPGDSLGIDLDLATNQMHGLAVATYLDSPQDAVVLDIDMATLPDGAGYAGQTVLDAKAKDLRVTVQNSGHRKQ